MISSKKFKDYTTLQQVGLILLVCSGLIVVARLAGLAPNTPWIQGDLSSYIALLGFLFYFLPKWSSYFR